MGTLIICITLIIIVSMVCNTIIRCNEQDNDSERMSRENQHLWKELEKWKP
jgi:hypothetical protein